MKKKLMLNKETVAVLNDAAKVGIKGGLDASNLTVHGCMKPTETICISDVCNTVSCGCPPLPVQPSFPSTCVTIEGRSCPDFNGCVKETQLCKSVVAICWQ